MAEDVEVLYGETMREREREGVAKLVEVDLVLRAVWSPRGWTGEERAGGAVAYRIMTLRRVHGHVRRIYPRCSRRMLPSKDGESRSLQRILFPRLSDHKIVRSCSTYNFRLL